MEHRRCSITGQEFSISEREQVLIHDFGLPLPEIAPIERWISIAARSMPFTFYRRTCPVTKKPILSRWTKKGAIVGVEPEWFWSDECDNTEAGQAYDFTRPFFDQFVEVVRKSYAQSINRINCEDSPYVNASFELRNCQLCFACERLEDCIYCGLCYDSRDLLLCNGMKNSELSYSCLDCDGVYGSRFLRDCMNCSYCYWCLDCIGCTNCFSCIGLRQAQDGYYAYNEKISRKEWEQLVKGFQFGSYRSEEKYIERAEKFFQGKRNYDTNFHNEECSRIDHVKNSKNTHGSMYSTNCEDCNDVVFCNVARDCYSTVWVHNSERCYMMAGGDSTYDCSFCDGAINAKNHLYSFCCFNGCEHLFGCFFLKRKNFCILNREYSKAEYFDLLPRVINHMKSTGEWGKWFPNELYGVGYRDSWGHFMFTDLTDDQILERDFLGESGEEMRIVESGIELPDHIGEFSEDLCDKEIRCEVTGKPFGIGKKELRAFEKHQAPIPRKHWSVVLTEMQRKTIKLELF